MIRLPRAAVLAIVIFLAVVFVLVGTSKLQGPSARRWTERFVRWGYPAGAARVVGVLEILGGLAVLIPKLRRAAAAMLIGIMLGALGTHLVHAEFLRLIAPMALGGLAFVVAQTRVSVPHNQNP
ncbi:MAG TPA: DoxX family protein [Thermoanaerobaculia bacterium]|nr:DoxX family protein [Thermoanaerobaculia bacterium]